MYLYHLNIGSNIGDSRSVMERAVAALSGLSVSPVRRSDIIESDPWGFESPHRFFNIGADITSLLPPEELLEETRRIERTISPASHRNPDGTYRDRLIDIDIIFCAELLPGAAASCGFSSMHLLRVNTPALTLPHPHAAARPFVTTPLLQLHPDFPLSSLTH